MELLCFKRIAIPVISKESKYLTHRGIQIKLEAKIRWLLIRWT